GDPQARQLRELDAVALADVTHEVRVAVLDAGAGVLEGVGPAVVGELVLPGVRAGAQHGAAVIDQGGLDPGGPELEAQVGASLGEEGGRIGTVGGGHGSVRHTPTKPSRSIDGNVHIPSRRAVARDRGAVLSGCARGASSGAPPGAGAAAPGRGTPPRPAA